MRIKMLNSDQLGGLIAEAVDLPTPELRKKWKEVLKQSAPDALNGKLLLRAFAHALQQQVHGSLSLIIRKRLQTALQQTKSNASRSIRPSRAETPVAKKYYGTFGGEAGTSNSVPASNTAKIPNRTLCAGTRLLREWQGINHEVLVLADGFFWHGKVYSSLSAIATEMTGVRWNGWIFFGLKQRQQRLNPLASRAKSGLQELKSGAELNAQAELGAQANSLSDLNRSSDRIVRSAASNVQLSSRYGA